MGPNKALKNLKEDITGFEENSWLCNFAFSKILITCVFGKQAKKDWV